MAAPINLAHVVFRTNQLNVMCDWYCSVLSAHITYGNEKIVFLTYDDEHHRVALIGTQTFGEKPEGLRVGFYHTAFTFADLPALFENYTRLAAQGIRPWRAINHGPTISLYYSDPDGNDVELQVDRFADAEAATAWMRGEAFAKNPIGIEFNPDEFLEQLSSGKPHAELMRRPDE